MESGGGRVGGSGRERERVFVSSPSWSDRNSTFAMSSSDLAMFTGLSTSDFRIPHAADPPAALQRSGSPPYPAKHMSMVDTTAICVLSTRNLETGRKRAGNVRKDGRQAGVLEVVDTALAERRYWMRSHDIRLAYDTLERATWILRQRAGLHGNGVIAKICVGPFERSRDRPSHAGYGAKPQVIFCSPEVGIVLIRSHCFGNWKGHL
jgi:hypothetical protein